MRVRAQLDHIRWGLFALLAVNLGLYAFTGRLSESLDAAVWYALLILFEIENRRPPAGWPPHIRHALTLLRLMATAGICAAAFLFVREREWLDAGNAALWIGVVIVLELELRLATHPDSWRRTLEIITRVLYAGLVIIALLWLYRGEWLNAYDALLWIAAFVLLEMGLLNRLTATAARD